MRFNFVLVVTFISMVIAKDMTEASGVSVKCSKDTSGSITCFKQSSKTLMDSTSLVTKKTKKTKKTKTKKTKSDDQVVEADFKLDKYSILLICIFVAQIVFCIAMVAWTGNRIHQGERELVRE